MRVTKLDVAEREIIAAVRLLFDGGDPIPIYMLANAAREIVATLCEKRGVRSMVDAIQESYPSLKRKEIYRISSKYASFFKHADNDPDAVLDGFDPGEAETALWVACFDFGRLCGGKPPEADAFELWFFATRDLLESLGMGQIEGLGGIHTLLRGEQIAIGKRFLDAACADAPAVKDYFTT